MRKSLKAAIGVALCLVLLLSIFIINSNNANASQLWTRIGEGNLKAENIDGKWILHSVPATYLDMLGVEGKDYRLLNDNVYEVDSNLLDLKAKKINSYKKSCKIFDSNIDIIITEMSDNESKQIFNSSQNSTQKLSNGKIVVDDGEFKNLWALDSNGEIEGLLDDEGLPECENIAGQIRKETNDNINILLWAGNPKVVGTSDTIAFMSNRDSLKDKSFSTSIYTISYENRKPKLIMDSMKYNSSIELLYTTENTIIGYVPSSDTIIVYNIVMETTEEIALNGHPLDLSPDGKYLLFRKIDNGYLLRDLNVLDLCVIVLYSGVKSSA